MEFKLNKIDTDIRLKMQENIKSDKIHSNKRVDEKKNFTKEHDSNYEGSKNKKERKKIVIDGIKYNSSGIDVSVEKQEWVNAENSIGKIIDAKE